MIDVKRILEKIQTNKKLQIIIGIVCLLLLIIIIKSGNKTKQYETQPIEKHTITQVVEASGTINPVNIVSVGSTVSGPISKIYVDYNSMVKKGQLLAEIDPRLSKQTVEQNRAAIASAQANLRDMQANAEMSRKSLRG